MASDLTDTQKINNLWKTSKGVVDINKDNNYVAATERGAVKNVLNESIFSEDVPDIIPGPTVNLNTFVPKPGNPSGGPNQIMPKYSVAALDLSFNDIGLESGQVPPGTPPNDISVAIGNGYQGLKLRSAGLPHLVYYHRIPLVEVPGANKVSSSPTSGRTSLFLPDPSNNLMSALRNTINFKKGNVTPPHYAQKFFIYNTGVSPPVFELDVQALDTPYFFVFDNESGYVLIYGTNDSSSAWRIDTANNIQLCVSLIRYEGALGASGGGPDGLQEGNVNLMQTLEIQGGTPKYHPIYTAPVSILGTFDHFFAMANYVIASVDNTSACAMGYFTLKITGNGYDTTCQFMATILDNNIPSIKILSSSVKDPLAGFGKLIMYDNRSVNGKWYICLGFDQTLRVGLNPSQPYYQTPAPPAAPTFPSWWNAAAAPIVDVVRITLVNNNANQNDTTLIPQAVGNWELNTPNAFFDPTLAPIHSGAGLWQIGQLGTGQPDPANTFVDRYKLVCNLLMGDATPDMNLSSDTTVNVFHNDIVMDTNTKIKILDLSSNSASTSRTGFYEYVSGGHHNHDLGTVTMEAEEIYLKSAKVTDINSTINVNGSINFGNDGWILNDHYGVFQEIQYTDGNFTSNDTSPGSGGEWVTIARTTLSPLAKTRSASAIFEIIDKSNTIDNAAVNGTTDPNGNFDPASFDEYILASVSWRYDVNDIRGLVSPTVDPNTGTIAPADVEVNIINSRCGNNIGTGSASRGYIGKLRVQTGLYTMPVAGGDRVAVAHLQLYRYANGVQAPNGTGAGKTDVKVRMVCNNLTDISNNTTNWEFSSTPHFLGIVHITEASTHIREYNLLGELAATNSRFNTNDKAVLNLNGGLGDKVSTGDLYFESPSGISGLGESFTNSLYTKNYYNDELENVALCRLSSFDISGILTGGLQANDNDWITIAAVGPRDNQSRRADGLFELTERTSGIQHTVIFRAGLCFSYNTANATSRQDNNYIEVISNRTYQTHQTFLKLRIMFNGNDTSSGNGTEPTTSPHRGTVYGGGVLQVQVDTISGSRKRGKCYLKIYQNTRQQGWISNDDVFAKYSQFASIPVWDTTYNNSSDNYTDNKFVDLTKNTQISTQKKSWKLYNLSGYPEDNKNTSSVWPGSSTVAGYPLNIKINNWLDMGGSTIVNLWDSPESWVDGATTIRRNGINLDDFNDYRAKSVVNLRTVNKYYQKYRAPLVPYVGTEAQINSYVNEMNMVKRFRTSEGVVTHLIEPSSTVASNTVSPSPEIQGLLYYNKFLARHYMLSNGVMNLSWGTSLYQGFNWLNGTINTDFTGNGQMTGIGDWDFANVGNAQSMQGVATSGDAIADGKLGWDRVTTIQFSTSSSPEVNAIARAGLIFSSPGYSNPGISGTKLRFRAHQSQYPLQSIRSVVKWKNDSIFYPNSDGFFNNQRSSINSPYDIWHHMPQKNMSGYILGATLYGYVEIRNGTSVWNLDRDQYKVIFCLIGAKYNEGSYSNIQELTDFATIDGNTVWNGNIGPNVTANNGEYLKFYPNGGNGELSKAIFIGKNGTYTPADPGLGVPSSGHPGQGSVDQRFDALGIRVKVEMRGTATTTSTQQRPEIHLSTNRTNRIIFHFLPLMSGTPTQTSTQNNTSDGAPNTVP